MDTVLHLKESLISRIRSSNDLNFLKALQTIFDSSEKGLFELTPEQESAIEQGRKDIQEGKFKSNEQVMKETEQWLKKL